MVGIGPASHEDPSMKKLLLIAALGATTLGGVAVAQNAPAQTAPERQMRADTNKDGAIDRAEFLAKAGQRFDRIDANKDGRVERTERRAMRDKVRATRDQRRAARATAQ